MANPAVVVDFVANTKDLQKGFQQAGGASTGFGSKLKGIAKTGALAGLAALTAAVKVGVGEFAEAQKVTAQTNAVLKSTGEAAGVSSKQVTDLAGALMKKTGIDDEAIQSGENLLLTFTNIRNEAGKGNDVFNQATATMTDMSVALGQDMKTSAVQLGKALNDPIKGITALSRVGVTFTDAQKKQIKALTESGDRMGAQKIILAELKKEFGGSAEAAGKTLGGQLNILKESFNNLAGTIVGKMIPPLTQLAKLLMAHKTTIVALVAVVVALGAAILAVSAATAAWNAITKIAAAATKAWAAAQWLINVAMEANPIGLVIIAIAAFVAGMIIAYKTSDKFRALVNKAFQAVLGVAKTLFNWLKSNWPLLLAILSGPIGLAVLAIVKNWDKIKRATTTAWSAVKGAITSAVSAIKGFLNGLATWISGFASGVLASALSRVKAVFGRIGDGAKAAFTAVKNTFNNMLDWLGNLVGRAANIAGRIASALKSPLNAVIGAWNSLGIPRVSITLPSKKILGKTIGGGSFGFGPFPFPDIPRLAKGGIVTGPTLALIGEKGPEAVVPLTEMTAPQVQVRVYIGDTELRGMVRTEIVDSNTGLARTILAGALLMALSATIDPGVRAVRLEYTIPAGGATVTLQRVGPSGTVAVVRGWGDTPHAPGLLAARDYEAPIGVPLTYTARTKNSSAVVIDTATTTITLTSEGCADTWLTDLARPINTLKVLIEQLPDLAYSTPATVHDIVGRRTPIVTADIARTPTFELSVLTETLDDRDAARAVLGNGVTVLLRTPPEEGIGNLYLAVTEFHEQRILTDGMVPDRRFVVSGRQVDRPDPVLYAPAAPSTYATVKAGYATYAALKAARSTYDAVLYDWSGSTPPDVVPWPPRDV